MSQQEAKMTGSAVVLEVGGYVMVVEVIDTRLLLQRSVVKIGKTKEGRKGECETASS